ncbi:GAF and ANTAR domain-containing protein [Lentzea flaviverrucosa]|uniref:GAF domain-containing protein n=1 Tax=Lentzea flaviverrucosa TaxID=200379 RepID=A0A1H9C7D1_9PSEU|nr:GAF and ANTAR domain-containing protein [Lentzea flaviverrucosa]RDI24461.1 GAF domain-containing protein [Lentzea flaviverrucosa]SEP96713.1 GAF domain-containing protein [Lentzea flaviverrucosa]
MSGSAPSRTERESRLLRTFVQLADTLVDDYDVVDVLHLLVEHCVQLLDATAAGLMLSDQHGGLRVVAYSSAQTRMLELFQLQASEGPCLDCVHSGEPVMVADLSTEVERWPRFVPLAIEEGFSSVHAVPMRLRRETIGTLNLFRRETGLLDEEDVLVVRALADTATIGILQERAIRRGEVVTEQLQTALNSRVVIEQAKGVLAFAGALEMEQAFHALRGYARKNGRRLADVAREVVVGELRPEDLLVRQPRSTDM